MKYRNALISCALSVLITGCANLNSVYRHNHLSKPGQTEFVDAKQRAIIASPIHRQWSKPDERNIRMMTLFRICSEPVPDVFSAYAFSGTAEAKKGVDDIKAKFAMTSAETASTIERTQVINMLRESMFRTCERFMNGAIDKDEMSIQTARDQRMMVATLAIEQLTGVVKNQPTILSTNSSATLSEEAKDYIDKLAKAESSKKKLEEEVETLTKADADAKAKYEALNIKHPEDAPDDAPKFCDAAIKAKKDTEANAAANANAASGATSVAPAAGPNSSTTVNVNSPASPDSNALAGAPNNGSAASGTNGAAAANAEAATQSTATPEQLAACEGAQNNASNAASALAGKKAELEAEKVVIAQQKLYLEHLQSQTLTAAATGAGGSGTSRTSEAHLQKVSEAVKTITMAAFNDQSEILFTCKKILTDPSMHKFGPTMETCRRIMAAQFIVNAELATEGKTDFSGLFEGLGLTKIKQIEIYQAAKVEFTNLQKITTDPVKYLECVAKLETDYGEKDALKAYYVDGKIDARKLLRDFAPDASTRAARIVLATCKS